MKTILLLLTLAVLSFALVNTNEKKCKTKPWNKQTTVYLPVRVSELRKKCKDCKKPNPPTPTPTSARPTPTSSRPTEEPLKKRKCVVWGDPHYQVAYGKSETSRNQIGDVLLAKTPSLEIHGRVAQWERDATVVASVAFRVEGCSEKFFIRGTEPYVNRNKVNVQTFNNHLKRCGTSVTRKLKEKFITEYQFHVKGKDHLVVLVGDVKGEVNWEAFTKEETQQRDLLGLSKYWMEVALVGFIKKEGACSGTESQGSGIFYNTRKLKKLFEHVLKSKCAEDHLEKAKRFCSEEFQDLFRRNACVFDECHKMSMLAEVTLKKSLAKLNFEAKIYNAKQDGDDELVKELEEERAELIRKTLGGKQVDIKKSHWK